MVRLHREEKQDPRWICVLRRTAGRAYGLKETIRGRKMARHLHTNNRNCIMEKCALGVMTKHVTIIALKFLYVATEPEEAHIYM